MDEFNILKSKLNSIINEYQHSADIMDFKVLLNELNKLERTSLTVSNNNFFSKIISSIRTRFFKKEKNEFDIVKYEEIKSKIIELYCNRILKKQYPFDIEKSEFGGDAYFKNSNGIQLNEKVLNEIRKLQVFYSRLKEKQNGKIEVYPWEVKKGDLENAVNREYLKISQRFLTTEGDLKEVFNNRFLEISGKNKKIRNKFMQSEIEPYYGNPKFICERSKYILQCMETILSEKDVKPENKVVTESLIEDARRIVKEIEKSKERLENKQDNKEYEMLKENFEKLLSYEDIALKDIEKIWNDYLTKPEEYKEGKRFAFLVHTYSGEIVEAEQMEKCCCTLITDKCMPITYGNIGVICGFNAANIGTMCTEDAGSWVISREKFFDDGMPVNWQFAEKVGNTENRVFYEYPKISKLILPTTMEREMLENNLKLKRKLENNQKYGEYTELFMTRGKNGEKIQVQEAFFTSEKVKQKASNIGNNPIMLDPSKGTIIPFFGHKQVENIQEQ